MTPAPVLEITRLATRNVGGLLDMLTAVERSGEAPFFAPHPFAIPYLQSLCAPERQDLHYVLTEDTTTLGYGLLRGWDEGYETPSLGIAIHPAYRARGYGALLMHFLHSAARARGAQRLRLRVHRTNAAAIALYDRLGYRFEPSVGDSPLLIAFKELAA